MFEEALGAKTFIVYPYSSWVRGLNKNSNGLLGQFITKRTDLRKVTDQEKRPAEKGLKQKRISTADFESQQSSYRQILAIINR